MGGQTDGETPPAARLDRYDMKIVAALERDGRLSWSDLAAEIGLSLTPTLRRVRKLEQSGVIIGYAAKVDRSALIGSMPVFISVKLERQTSEILESIEKLVEGLPQVVAGYLMSGTNDYLLHAFVRDLAHYRELLATLTRASGIAHIESSFVLKTFKA
ncbi:Lrp/AsnC family transcriptional regulator [Rhizorhabdus phycosphaerae]|uniref:Lrp/AsnC family transcriptional regulator n=1 Tax=Rhizorhabdus phycosphaerae TaxID=2711156 RepID=UPI0013EC9E5A|nr:Lrp/AsnC family transcriptional regulator [Rhizorhabdus phycosphaerae]